MPQLEHIEAIERRLWSAADTLRANSTYASNEYFLPVMGLIFLRHACSRGASVSDKTHLQLFEDTATPLHRQINLPGWQTNSLADARDLLLPRLMNGEINV